MAERTVEVTNPALRWYVPHLGLIDFVERILKVSALVCGCHHPPLVVAIPFLAIG